MLKYVEGQELAGKTIIRVETLHEETFIFFDDGSYTRAPMSDFAELSLREAARYYQHATLIKLGLFTEEELAEEKARADVERAARTEKYDREIYARLKAKFEPGGS